MAADRSKTINEAILEYNLKMDMHIHSLKVQQISVLNCLMDGKDCICSLPTGYGKSLIYELLPFMDKGCLVVVVVPLNAILNQQLAKLGDLAVSLGPGKSDINSLKTGNYSYLLCHPEQILDNRSLNDVFCSETFSKRKIYMVVDEAHCILEWGDEFRPDFQKLYQLRSLFNCQVLALSATITDAGKKRISTNLLMKNFDIISESPAKDNIKLVVKRRPSPTASGNNATTPYDYIFHPIILKLKHELQDFEITIIYCKAMQWIGYGYEAARRMLGADFYAGDRKPENARVVMFHSSMEKETGQLKNMVLTSLQKPDKECHIRLILSSVALGMGADLKYVKRVIHAGPPTNLETYIQEIVRAGRTESGAEAVLYFNNSDISGPTMRKDMQDYCRDTEKCRRDIINEHFGFQTKDKLTDCCNFCDVNLGIEWEFSNLTINQ